jgi:plasmid segregation protein ParM
MKSQQEYMKNVSTIYLFSQFLLNFPSMPFSSDLRMLISQQSSTTPVRPAESINTKTEVFFMRELKNTKIIAVDVPEKEGINHAEQYPQHKPAL